MRKALAVITMVVGLTAFAAAPAYANEPIDACTDQDPDFHFTVTGVLDACGHYPEP